MERALLWLLFAIPFALAAQLFALPPILTFIFSGLAIIPLAKLLGEATEELSLKTTAAFGGLLNVTFGNAPEIIIGIFGIRAGLIEVVKASITGSIIGNLLLVLGTAIAAGGFRHKRQVFNRTAALASGSMLFLAVTALMMPALLPLTVPNVSSLAVTWLSILVAICMLGVYAATLVFSLHTHRHLYVFEEGHEAIGERWTVAQGVGMLLLATAGTAWMSDMLIAAVHPVLQSMGWTELFIGVVLIAAFGNAAEHASAITMALRNKMTLAIEISVGSATQVAMFVAPVFVLVSTLFHNQMSLVFNTFELASIFLSVIMVNLVIEDGESNWLEGTQLVVAYLIIAIAFFVHP